MTRLHVILLSTCVGPDTRSILCIFYLLVLIILNLLVILLVCCGPHAILARGEDTLWIKCILNLLAQLHVRTIVKIVSARDLIHQRQMGTILSPSTIRRFLNQKLDELVGASAHLGVLSIEEDANNVMDLAHTNKERAEEIKTKLLAATARQLVLSLGIVSSELGDGRKEEMPTIWQPRDPVQFSDRRDSHKCILSRLQRLVVRPVLGEVELGTRDLAEGAFNDLPENFAHLWRSVYATVKVPAAKA